MNTVRKLLYKQVLSSVVLVTLGFLALFFFIDVVDELRRVGRDGYGVFDAFVSVALNVPGHAYDIFPIALLIGSILSLSQLAQSSEFTILRTSGLGPGRALKLLAGIGLLGTLLVGLLGEMVAPGAEEWRAERLSRFQAEDGVKLGRSGAWLREQAGAEGGLVTINVGSALGHQRFKDVRIFEFDGSGHLHRQITAETADIERSLVPNSEQLNAGARPATHTTWTMHGVTDTRWAPPEVGVQAGVGTVQAVTERPEVYRWASSLSSEVVAASVLSIDSMTTLNLWRYTRHLSSNLQDATRHEIRLWKRLLAPWACLVMVALSLPFAYLHARSGSASLLIFGGIMVGISFVLVNHIAGHLGLLHQWTPWLVATLPPLAYLALAMSAFVWLVRYR